MTQPPDDAEPRPDQPGYWESQAAGQQPSGAPQQPYGAPQPYGAQPPPGGGYPAYGYGYQPVQKHANATTAMVLGIVGLAGGMACGVLILASPFAWVLGAKAVREIDQSGGRLGGRNEANAGKIMGIIGTVLLVLAVVAITAFIGIGVSGGFDDSDGNI